MKHSVDSLLYASRQKSVVIIQKQNERRLFQNLGRISEFLKVSCQQSFVEGLYRTSFALLCHPFAVYIFTFSYQKRDSASFKQVFHLFNQTLVRIVDLLRRGLKISQNGKFNHLVFVYCRESAYVGYRFSCLRLVAYKFADYAESFALLGQFLVIHSGDAALGQYLPDYKSDDKS